MSGVVYLADTSAYLRLGRGEHVEEWASKAAAGVVAVCPAVEAEVLFTARGREDYRDMCEEFRTAVGWVPMPDNVWVRVRAVQDQLAERSRHRAASVVDLLVAATAEMSGLTVLHYDRDFETIATVTGQPVEWLAKPGSLN
ncbi:type II toxin-antitoxin system toxin ribonuclease C21 [Yinghuangia aomiensis]|uniref:Ribonuclease VapC n=1 Tax=Yinghuangia aomiensis TaxID=676205 RepID=A0ABP9IGR0_9ACTN